jgi:2-iminoacetate synthase ThiH
MSKFTNVLERSRSGTLLTPEEVFALLDGDDLPAMMAAATERRDNAHGSIVSYSRKVFIPLTQLCRDSCHYCTFAHPPRDGRRAYLSADEVRSTLGVWTGDEYPGAAELVGGRAAPTRCCRYQRLGRGVTRYF